MAIFRQLTDSFRIGDNPGVGKDSVDSGSRAWHRDVTFSRPRLWQNSQRRHHVQAIRVSQDTRPHSVVKSHLPILIVFFKMHIDRLAIESFDDLGKCEIVSRYKSERAITSQLFNNRSSAEIAVARIRAAQYFVQEKEEVASAR